MLKRILIAALWLPLAALAQSYPSPTFNNVTVQGTLSVTGAPTFTAPVPISSGGTGQTTASAAAHALGLGTTDTPTFFGITVNGSTAHGVTVGQGNGLPFTWTAAGTAGQPLLSGGASADPSYGTLGVTAGGTGGTSLAQYNILAGNGTGAIFAIGPNTSSYVLTSNGAASFPSFQAIPWGAPGAIGTTTPAAGKFTTLQATAAITPSTTAGIVGTTAGDNANAGSVGEYISATNSAGTSLTSATAATVTSILLTAGDWNVGGTVVLAGGGGASMTNSVGGISSTAATFGGIGTYSQLATGGLGSGGAWVCPTPTVRYNVTTNTTVYLIGLASFSSGTVSASGVIWARRVR